MLALATLLAFTLLHLVSAVPSCPAPTITFPSSAGYTFQSRKLTFRGTTKAYAAPDYSYDCEYITITVNGVKIVNQGWQTNRDGTWQIQNSSPIDPSQIPNGQYTASVQAGISANGNLSPAATISINIAINSCAVPTITTPAAGYTYADETPVLRGRFTVAAGQVICDTLSVSTDVDQQYASATINSDGTFVVNSLSRLPTGNTVFLFTAADTQSAVYSSTKTLSVSATNSQACGPASFEYPTPGGVVGNTSPFIYGLSTWGAGCDYAQITLSPGGGGAAIETIVVDAGPNNGFSFSYTPAAPLTSGSSYTISVVLGPDSTFPSARSSSVTQTTFTVNSNACPSPTFGVSPAAGSTVTTASPAFTLIPGSNDISCVPVQFYFKDVNNVAASTNLVYDSGSNTYTITPSYGLGPGDWQIQGAMADVNGDRQSSVITRSFKVNPPQCTNVPVVTGPAAGQTVRQTYNFNPTFSVNAQPGCILLKSVITRVSDGAVTPQTATYYGDQAAYALTTAYQGVSDGATYTLTASMSYLNGQGASSSSAVRTFTVRAGLCTTPVITSPVSGTYPRSASLTVSGSQDDTYALECNTVAVLINGVLAGRVQAGSGNGRKRNAASWNLANTTPLVPGRYTLTSYSGFGPDQSDMSNAVIYDVVDSAATGGTSPRRKRMHCGKNEEICRTAIPNGKLIEECVPDLDTNLERCGACNGPDCTGIPNVDEVRCFEGRCQISSCIQGYEVVGDRCERQSSSVWDYIDFTAEELASI